MTGTDRTPDRGEAAGPGRGGASTGRENRPVGEDGPVIPDRSDDDRDQGWGERGSEDEHERYLRERPPHWQD